MKPNVVAVWDVDSFNRQKALRGESYTVALRDDGTMHCTCEAYRWGQGTECKHIHYVRNHEPYPLDNTDNYVDILRHRSMLDNGKTLVLDVDGDGFIHIEQDNDAYRVRLSSDGRGGLRVEISNS